MLCIYPTVLVFLLTHVWSCFPIFPYNHKLAKPFGFYCFKGQDSLSFPMHIGQGLPMLASLHLSHKAALVPVKHRVALCCTSRSRSSTRHTNPGAKQKLELDLAPLVSVELCLMLKMLLVSLHKRKI